MKIERFNDTLALVYVVACFLVWVAQGISIFYLTPEINTLLGTLLTLVVQHYFRKAKGNG